MCTRVARIILLHNNRNIILGSAYCCYTILKLYCSCLKMKINSSWLHWIFQSALNSHVDLTAIRRYNLESSCHRTGLLTVRVVNSTRLRVGGCSVGQWVRCVGCVHSTTAELGSIQRQTFTTLTAGLYTLDTHWTALSSDSREHWPLTGALLTLLTWQNSFYSFWLLFACNVKQKCSSLATHITTVTLLLVRTSVVPSVLEIFPICVMCPCP